MNFTKIIFVTVLYFFSVHHSHAQVKTLREKTDSLIAGYITDCDNIRTYDPSANNKILLNKLFKTKLFSKTDSIHSTNYTLRNCSVDSSYSHLKYFIIYMAKQADLLTVLDQYADKALNSKILMRYKYRQEGNTILLLLSETYEAVNVQKIVGTFAGL